MRIPLYTCTRCNHSWYPRPKRDGTLRKPVTCPNKTCKSPFWDRERERKEQS